MKREPVDPIEQHLRDVDAYIAFCLAIPILIVVVSAVRAFWP